MKIIRLLFSALLAILISVFSGLWLPFIDLRSREQGTGNGQQFGLSSGYKV